MKNRFVKLTLFLCMIMLIGTSSSAFAASGSCGTQKGVGRNCGTVNYMTLFTNSNNECMNALLKGFGLKVKQPVSSNNGNNSGNNNGSTNNSTNNTNNAANNSGNNCSSGNCNTNNNADSNKDCVGSNCGNSVNTGSNQNCAGGNCNVNGNTGNKQDCIGGNCGNTGSGNQNQGSGTNAGTSSNAGAGSGSNSNSNVSSYAQQVANLVNEERSKAGLSSLTMNASLSRVAQAKAEDMRDKNYFSHTSPTYGSPFDMMKQFGISYSAAGENIAKGQRSPESVMTAWMNSQGHRANILNSSYEQIGVGYCTDANGNTYWVQMFIK